MVRVDDPVAPSAKTVELSLEVLQALLRVTVRGRIAVENLQIFGHASHLRRVQGAVFVQEAVPVRGRVAHKRPTPGPAPPEMRSARFSKTLTRSSRRGPKPGASRSARGGNGRGVARLEPGEGTGRRDESAAGSILRCAVANGNDAGRSAGRASVLRRASPVRGMTQVISTARRGFDADLIGSSSGGPRPGGRGRSTGCGAGRDRWRPPAGGDVRYRVSGDVSRSRATSISGTHGPDSFLPHSLVR